jgi:hypothetical protein
VEGILVPEKNLDLERENRVGAAKIEQMSIG